METDDMTMGTIWLELKAENGEYIKSNDFDIEPTKMIMIAERNHGLNKPDNSNVEFKDVVDIEFTNKYNKNEAFVIKIHLKSRTIASFESVRRIAGDIIGVLEANVKRSRREMDTYFESLCDAINL